MTAVHVQAVGAAVLVGERRIELVDGCGRQWRGGFCAQAHTGEQRQQCRDAFHGLGSGPVTQRNPIDDEV